MENYVLHDQLTFAKSEYLIKTLNTESRKQIISSVFRDGALVSSICTDYNGNLSADELFGKVERNHQETKNIIDTLFSLSRRFASSQLTGRRILIGRAFARKGMYKEAKFEFERLLEKAHKYPIIEYYLGHCNLMLGNYAEAVIHLENATAVKKDYADYHYYYGRSLLESGHCRRAIQELMKAIKINPYYDKAYFFLALAYLKNAITKEDYTLAKDVFERTEGFMTKAAQIQPAYKTAEFDQGLRLLRDRELESACREFEAAFKEEVHTTTDFVLDFYIKYLQENDNLSLDYIRSYIQQLEDLIKKYPRYADLHFELGIAKVIMSKILLYRALRNFEEALSINAKFAKAEVKRNLLRNEQKGMKALLLTLLEP